MKMAQNVVSIPEFYSGKNIFITGATGFIGKALIEKLLRSCPNIGTIYILMRPKKGKELSERLQELTDNALYERLKREQPHLRLENKIVPLAGNMTELNLGLLPGDRTIVTQNVHIIFHVAASVRFDDSLTDAVILNVRGTREVCQLALDTQHLLALVHVSTAFANCDRAEAKEVLYHPKADWRNTIEVAEKLDSHLLDVLTEKYIDGMPNTYCFTKNVAEHVVHDMCKGKIAVKIFRPSIVLSSLREEPVAGWIDNFNGPIGLLTAYGKGIMRTIYANDKYKPDYIPIDVATKALIVSTWDLAIRGNKLEAEIMQCTSHNVADWLRPSIEKIVQVAFEVIDDTPFNDIMWYPSTHSTTSTTVCFIRTILFMLVPSLLLDGLFKITGRKPLLTKLQRKMYIAQLALRYFMNNEWSYPNDNLLALRKTILEADAADWDYDFYDYDFKTYARQCRLGCRRYLLRESDDTLPAAKRHSFRMYWLDVITKLLLYILVGWYIWRLEFIQQQLCRLKYFGGTLIPIK